MSFTFKTRAKQMFLRNTTNPPDNSNRKKDIDLNFANQLPTDTPGKITPRTVNPSEIGSYSAFGGTSGDTKFIFNTNNTNTDNNNINNNNNNNTNTNNNNNNNLISDNVLNKKNTITFKDLNTLVTAEAAKKLQSLNSNAEQNLLKEAESKRFFNLPLREIIDKTIMTVIQILSEILQLENPTPKKVAELFMQEDRMIYSGVFFVVVSILLMLLFLSS